jgi:hypothetical protein
MNRDDAMRLKTSPSLVPLSDNLAADARRDLTYDEFQELAAIARVRDDASKLSLYNQVNLIVVSRWELQDLCRACGPDFFRLERQLTKLLITWAALTRAASNFKKVEDEFESVLTTLTRKANLIYERKNNLYEDYVYRAIVRLAELASTSSVQVRSGRPVGRPAGSYGRALFRDLVVDLLTSATAAGGRLSFSKEDESKGGLCRALRFLGPFLPPGAVPRKLPLGTIARIVRSSSQAQ